MRTSLFVLLLILAGRASAVAVRLQLSAPAYAGQRALLYQHLDLFTGRTELLTHARIDDQGRVLLEADVRGTVKASIRIGEVSADLWLKGGSYTIDFPAPDPKAPRSMNGTTEVDPVFKNLDPLDINALIGDLNERLDAFLAEDLATDQRGGMQAVDVARATGSGVMPDSVKRPGTLFITPEFSPARIDSFEQKLRKFYAEVKDPWFWQDLEYGVAGLRFGPRVNDRDLFDRYLKGKPVLYDVPEYVRFVNSFFEEHLMRGPFRTDEAALTRAVNEVRLDSLRSLFAKNDFLKDPRLCELVVMKEVYANHYSKLFDRVAMLKLLDTASSTSQFPEHKRIAENMHWDLVTMKTGGTLPSLVLRSPEGTPVRLDTLLHDATCIVVTASWCVYCEQELVALEALFKEYGAYLHVVGISLDRDMNALEKYVQAHPQRNWPWLFGGDDPTIMDVLRLHSIPTFYLLNDNVLAYSPAPPPTNGLPAILHRIRTEADERSKIKPNDGPRAPKRR
jgi:thiol-disulfide isomerase/thioredoxin